MFKTIIKRILYIFCGMLGIILFASIYIPATQANGLHSSGSEFVAADTPAATTTPGATGNATVSLSLPGGTLIGHPGTLTTIAGKGFAANSQVNLYTTADATACSAAQGLPPFASAPQVNAKGDGSFTVQGKWPSNANTATTSYYICAVSADGTQKAVSAQPFTVANPVTVVPGAPTASAGSAVTISGQNWLPSQNLSITLSTAGAVVASGKAVPDAQNGNFTATINLPASAASGAYSVSVVADTEPTLAYTQDNFITVSAGNTPTPAVTPTVAATATPTATPTTAAASSGSGSSGKGGGNGALTGLIFALGGVGIILVVVGIIMLSAYSRRV